MTHRQAAVTIGGLMMLVTLLAACAAQPVTASPTVDAPASRPIEPQSQTPATAPAPVEPDPQTPAADPPADVQPPPEPPEVEPPEVNPPEASPQEETPREADDTPQTPVTDVPADSTAAPEPDTVEWWLDRIEKETATIKTLRSKVRYDTVQELQGDEQRHFGKLVFVAGPPAKFAVHFHAKRAGDTPSKLDKWYIFDGKWLVERDNLNRKFVKRQIVPPDASAEHADPLTLGEGPFVMPMGASKERTLKRFDVTLVEPDEEDPSDTVHLNLIAKPNRDIEYDRIDLWYSRKTLLPVKAATHQSGSEDEHIFHLLGKVQLNEEVKAGEIDTSVPKNRDRGWHIEIMPWQEPAEPSGP